MKKLIHGIGITLIAIAGPTFADCAPEKLIRMVTQNVTPGIPADSFAAKPKVMYRLGNGRTRLEEQPDPVDGVQLLIITDAPHVWHIDLVSRTGETMVDDSTPPAVVLPVFSEEELPEEIRAVEYGCELQFMKDPATTHEIMKSGNGTKHSIRSGKWKFTIVTREGSDRPIGAMLSENDKVVGAIRYVAYQTMESVPEGLFAPPAGIVMKPALSPETKGSY